MSSPVTKSSNKKAKPGETTSNTKCRYCTVAIVASIVTSKTLPFIFHGETPLRRIISNATSSDDVPILGDPTYEYRKIKAPIATGQMLQFQSFVLTQSPFGPFLRRILLNRNGVGVLKDLASQLDGLVPPLHHPMRKLNDVEYEVHVKAAQYELEENVRRKKSNKKNNLVVGDLNVERFEETTQCGKLHKAYVSQDVTPTDVIRVTLSAIMGTNGLNAKYHFLASINETLVYNEAHASTERYRKGKSLSFMDGIPILIKDMIKVQGLPLYEGSPYKSAYASPSTSDDELVSRLRKAGAIILGTATMGEGGVSTLGHSTLHDGPYNAYDIKRYSGGSSSGSAVAVALGVVPMSVGFDGGGSIRIPAAWNGIVGLATTYGRVGYDTSGVTMVKSGPIASTVGDAALAYEIMGNAPREHYFGNMYGGLGLPPVHLSGYPTGNSSTKDGFRLWKKKRGPLSDVRVGIFYDHFNDADNDVVSACNVTLTKLVSKGVTLVPISIPNLSHLRLAHAMKISTEFALKWMIPYWDQTGTKPSMEPNTRITCGLGMSVTAVESLAADKLRHWAYDYVTEEIFRKEKLDAIVSPTTPMSIPPIVSDDAKVTGESNVPFVVESMKFIFLANLLGLPAVTVPIPRVVGVVPTTEDDDEKEEEHEESDSTEDEEEDVVKMSMVPPPGLQFTGNHWDEAKLLRLAREVELDVEQSIGEEEEEEGEEKEERRSCVSSGSIIPRPKDYFDALKVLESEKRHRHQSE